MGLKIVIIALLSAPVFAQDSTYVRHFKDKLSVQMFALNTYNRFNVYYINENLRVDIIPNQKTTLNIGMQYDIASFSFGFAPSFFARNRDNQDSKILSFSTVVYPGRFMQVMEFYYQKGMSLVNETPYVSIYLPQFRSIKIGGSTSFLFNRHFSYRAVSLQNTKQLRSQGSFSPGIFYYYTSLDGRKDPSLGSRSNFLDMAAEMAYYYNWVIAKDFLLASGTSIGAGVSWADDGDDSYTASLYKASFMLAPGYNSERWFGGAQFRIHAGGHESKSTVEISDTIGYVTAFIGYRFDAPPFLERQKYRIKNKLKI